MSQYIGRTGLAYARMWHHVDVAKDPRTLGRLANNIALVLMGKHKPIYHPSTDCGDYVVATNCKHIYTTGNKMETKLYRRHSGRPGHMKENTMEDLVNRKGGGEILRKAVYGMLPKNRLRKFRIERLKTFEGSKNDYAQNVFASYDMVPEIKAARAAKKAENKQ
ncbi:large ribosomal subunit protein uL13m [Trichomonascus vanleenenianus]|uniref:mitochondrial 54S ribosomal protein uL13m MRPL23 n=1 Tax=Trichomonascus vanleenenianus TaxID=2268995 RepID=UPI003ECAF50D